MIVVMSAPLMFNVLVVLLLCLLHQSDYRLRLVLLKVIALLAEHLKVLPSLVRLEELLLERLLLELG
jgi:hypothetical protein